MRRALSICFSLLCLNAVSAEDAATKTISDRVVEKVDPSVVAIQHRRAGGSGFIISPDGYIFSNGHVVTRNDAEHPKQAEESITVILNDERKYSARVLGFSMDPDVALLKIEPDEPLQPVEFADSREVTTGQKCFAVGTPVGLKRTFTSGILSNVDRADLGTYTKVLQTDAAINSGNSGGPLFDEGGRVLGINTYASKGSNNLGFTIPIHVALAMKDAFLEEGQFIPSTLWFCVLSEVYDELAETLEVDGGVLVHHVEPETPVAEAGLEAGDVIVALDDKPCAARTRAAFLTFNWELSVREPGTTVVARVLRGKGESRRTLDLTLPFTAFDPMPAHGRQPGNMETDSYRLLGLGYQSITLFSRIHRNLPDEEGVLVKSVSSSKAAGEAGVRKHDMITHVAGTPIADVASFEKALEARLAERPSVIPLTIQRRSHTYRYALTPRYDLSGKRAVVLVPESNFEHTALIRRELLSSGATVEIHPIDTETFEAVDVRASGIDILLLCGTDRPSGMANNDSVLALVKKVKSDKGVLAAVGEASLALMRADPDLGEMKMTTSESVSSRAIELGAQYTGKDVEDDDKLVTTTGRNFYIMRSFLTKLREKAR